MFLYFSAGVRKIILLVGFIVDVSLHLFGVPFAVAPFGTPCQPWKNSSVCLSVHEQNTHAEWKHFSNDARIPSKHKLNPIFIFHIKKNVIATCQSIIMTQNMFIISPRLLYFGNWKMKNLRVLVLCIFAKDFECNRIFFFPHHNIVNHMYQSFVNRPSMWWTRRMMFQH